MLYEYNVALFSRLYGMCRSVIRMVNQPFLKLANEDSLSLLSTNYFNGVSIWIYRWTYLHKLTCSWNYLSEQSNLSIVSAMLGTEEEEGN